MKELHVNDPLDTADQRSINASLRARVAELEDRVASLETRFRSMADGHDPTVKIANPDA